MLPPVESTTTAGRPGLETAWGHEQITGRKWTSPSGSPSLSPNDSAKDGAPLIAFKLVILSGVRRQPNEVEGPLWRNRCFGLLPGIFRCIEVLRLRVRAIRKGCESQKHCGRSAQDDKFYERNVLVN